MVRFFASAVLLAIAITLIASSAGCQRLRQYKWRGTGFDADTNSLTENLRPPADERQMSGFDERARDIERNLGLR